MSSYLGLGRQMIGLKKLLEAWSHASQLVDCLPLKHEALGSVPSTTYSLVQWQKPVTLSYMASSCLKRNNAG